MTQERTVEASLRSVDEMVIQALMDEMPGMDRLTATRIYVSVMTLRDEGINEINKRGKENTIASVLTSEVFLRLLLLVALPLLRVGYAPLIRVVSRVGR
jgi:hypothetical protein